MGLIIENCQNNTVRASIRAYITDIKVISHDRSSSFSVSLVSNQRQLITYSTQILFVNHIVGLETDTFTNNSAQIFEQFKYCLCIV